MLYSTDGPVIRKKYNPVKTAVVVTPTIGSKHLLEAVFSVKEQITDYDIKHLVVFDGPIEKEPPLPLDTVRMHLPWNVGKDGYYGHRVYASVGHLINADVVFFLDEDNWYLSSHIQSCMELLDNDLDLDFCFSSRNICDPSGKFLTQDRFEAIGQPPLMLVDTSSYCFRTEFLVKYGYLWHWKWGADRRFFQLVSQVAKYQSTGVYSLNYRLDGNPGSPTKEFFFEGNRQAGFNQDGTEKHE